MCIHDIMSAHVEYVSPDDTLEVAASRMRDLGLGSLPVCENHGVVGMLTDRDITIRAVALGLEPGATRVSEVMSAQPYCCYDDQDVEVAVHLMQSQQIRRVLVLDRDKRLVGIVSLGDLAVESGTPEHAGEILQDLCASGVHRCGITEERR